MRSPTSVTVRAPAKINLELSVGRPAPDGYHPLATVFLAVSLHDEVTATAAPPGVVEVLVTGAGGVDVTSVPRDASNLAARAARLLMDHAEPAEAGGLGVRLHIDKRIPVAGGMAGGSADAAAALVACDALWGLRLSRAEIHAAAARLGSDVPFALVGGTAVGTGRGDRLTPALAHGQWHWVLLVADGRLATPAVYAELDRLREGRDVPRPRVSDRVMAALRAGDPAGLGAVLRNDLQVAAVSLRPALGRVLDQVLDLQVPGAVVSGSGPTVAVLAEDPDQADELVVALDGLEGVRAVLRADGPVPGCRVVDVAE
ncbi:MAG: 4-(cytidine 5'-diphospho)-2-C-methyl-D-erythritol kinase [Kineosporiaceae bacterium]